jgi:hypothetical protein
MANSKGQAMGRGHSKGHFGHGGIHAKGGSVTAMPSNAPKNDHLRSMVGRGQPEMDGGQFQGGGPGMIG